MASASVQPTLATADAFLEWDQSQPDPHEFVDGVPVAMVGTRRRHDRITVNLIRELGNQLRGTPCGPMTDDVATKIPMGNVRRPDVTVQGAPMDDDALATTEPRAVFEVLSPSTAVFDQMRKMDEYRSLASMACIVLLDSESPQVMAWARSGGEWRAQLSLGLETICELPALGLALRLADIYEGVSFPAKPRIVLQ